jgi:hypothetical protein
MEEKSTDIGCLLRRRIAMRVAEVSGLAGLWRRSLIVRADGTRDTETWVRWLQGPSLYADLRQPAGRPDFSGVRCLRDLTMPQLDWMAAQDGFAGQLLVDDAIFEWRRDIDFQPPGPTPDRGLLERDGDVMIEAGYHSPYIEHWRAESGPPPLYALRLRDSAAGCAGQIVRAGDLFSYARGRAACLPELADLRACIAGAGSVALAQDMADCEISFGAVTAAGWTIERSTLPFREGRRLFADLSPDLDRFEALDRDVTGHDFTRRWAVTAVEGDAVHAVFRARN